MRVLSLLILMLVLGGVFNPSFSLASDASNIVSAINKIQSQHGGQVFAIEQKKLKQNDIYQIRMLQSGQFFKANIDPQNGTVISHAEEEFWLFSPLSADSQEKLTKKKVSFSEAVMSINKKNASNIDNAEFMVIKDRAYYLFSMKDGRDFFVNTSSGIVLPKKKRILWGLVTLDP